MIQHMQRFTMRRGVAPQDSVTDDCHQQSKMRVIKYAIGLFVAATLWYGLSATITYSGDDLQYASIIQSHVTGDVIYYPTGDEPYLTNARPSIDPLPINPRYLLEWPTSVLAAKLAYVLGFSGNVIVPIQILRIVVGALGLTAFFLAIVQLTRNIAIGSLTALGLGLTVSYWTYSTHVDQSMNAVALLCLAFYVFVRQRRTAYTWRGQLLLISVLALASFYNLTAAISAIAFGIGVALFSHRTSLFSRVQRLGGFGLLYTAIVAVGIVSAIAIFDSPASILDPNLWREATFAGRPDYMVDPIHDAVRSAFGLGRSQILFPGVYGSLNYYIDDAPAVTRVLLAGYYGIVLLLLASPIVLLAVRRRELGEKGKVVTFLFVWLAAHTLFNWFWDPGYNKYWLIPLVCCWALVALGLDHIRTSLTRYYRPALSVCCAFVTLSLLVNATSQILPDSRMQENKLLSAASQLEAQSQPTDLFLSPGHPMDFYVSFFGRRDILSTELASLATENNRSVLMSSIKDRIAAHRADGGNVYVYGLEPLNTDQRTDFLELLGRGTLTTEWTTPGTTIYRWNSTGKPAA